MRVLVTGGCGFIGVNLVARLSAIDGMIVHVFDNNTVGKRRYLADLPCVMLHGDVRDRAELYNALEDIDAVVHLAADTGVVDSIADPEFNFETNVKGTLNLLEAMRARNIRRLINASTGGAIIGRSATPVNETMAPHPSSPYGASKLAAEGYCSAYAESYGLQPLSLRFSNVYGPRSYHKGSVVAAFYKRILEGKPLTVYGDGTQIRDYIYVDDICNGIIRGLHTDVVGPIQLGSGIPYSLSEVLRIMNEIVSPYEMVVRHLDFRAGEIRSTYCNINRARELLFFDPQTSLEDGLRKTWKWFLHRYGARN